MSDFPNPGRVVPDTGFAQRLWALLLRNFRLSVALAALPGVLGLLLLIVRKPHGGGGLYFEYSNMLLGHPAMRDWLTWFPHREGPMPTNVVVLDGPQIPYLDFSCEYPPLALAVMAAPRLLAATSEVYDLVYRILAALATLSVLALALSFVRGAQRPPQDQVLAALAWSGAVFANGSMITGRFDIYSVALVVLALWLLQRQQYAWAGAALGLGAAIKLWPLAGLACAVVFIRQPRKVIAFVAGVAGAFLLPHVILAVVWGAPSWSYLGYHAARGIHIESAVGDVVFLWRYFTGDTPNVILNFGAYHLELEPAFASSVSKAWFVALLPLLGLAAFRAWRAGTNGAAIPDVAVLLLTACVAWVLVAAKVYSGEYLIWLAFLVVLPTDKAWLWRVGLVVVAGMLTKRVYTTYDAAISGELMPYVVLAVRNVAIGLVLALSVRGASLLARGVPQVTSSSGTPGHLVP